MSKNFEEKFVSFVLLVEGVLIRIFYQQHASQLVCNNYVVDVLFEALSDCSIRKSDIVFVYSVKEIHAQNGAGYGFYFNTQLSIVVSGCLAFGNGRQDF